PASLARPVVRRIPSPPSETGSTRAPVLPSVRSIIGRLCHEPPAATLSRWRTSERDVACDGGDLVVPDRDLVAVAEATEGCHAPAAQGAARQQHAGVLFTGI